ncbi:MAG TPA: nucleoside monophosphate kinase [Candidatus Paceibacterota bacterium]|nr:nucleoside monophosphate kinase [Candidatus Paceibacterota bacterium]
MPHTKPDIVLIIGRPGAGKGTQAKLLAKRLRWIRISSGDRIKEIRDGNEPFSERVREMYDKGTLLPDWLADYLLESALLELEPHVGVVAEGFARTENQARHFYEIVSWLGRKLQVLYLDVSEDEARRRMLERGKTENRPDSDDEDKITERFQKFTDQTEPGLTFFRELGLVVEVNGEQDPEKVAEDIEEILRKA